jgi:hypothetical protein
LFESSFEISIAATRDSMCWSFLVVERDSTLLVASDGNLRRVEGGSLTADDWVTCSKKSTYSLSLHYKICNVPFSFVVLYPAVEGESMGEDTILLVVKNVLSATCTLFGSQALLNMDFKFAAANLDTGESHLSVFQTTAP